MIETIGRYRIEGALGEGAMADVYRAYDPSINRPLAIKVLKSEFLRDRQYADRFLREAKAAGALNHPNIVTVFDVGEAEGHPYIGMELLQGMSLDQLLAKGPLDPVTTLRIGIQLADALAFAHAQGVVHRDIKPSNIIVSPDGQRIKLLDFGIARVADAVFEAESVKTQVGQVLGTPRYMSPEQALGGTIDGRSDLFSVGVVLYEMLSGRRAFPGASSATLAIQIVQRDPEPLATVAPETPGGVQFIVNKLLAKQPERRFASGAQLSEAMRLELAALTAVNQEQGSHSRYLPIQVRLPILLALITALVLGAAIWTVLSQQYQAMEQVALASGDTISEFVASNAGLRAVENATLPPAQQDWAPVDAFVRAAVGNPDIRRIVVVGADGVVRAASDPALTGKPYLAPTGEDAVEHGPGVRVTAVEGGQRAGAFRFIRPIVYAGRSFGQVEVEVSKGPLESAGRLAQFLMLALGLITLGGVAATSYLGARALAAPIRRLKAALLEVARGNLDFRISHHRRDEFGELFNGLNLAVGSVQERLASAEHLALNTSAPVLANPDVRPLPPSPAIDPVPSPEPPQADVHAGAGAHSAPMPEPAAASALLLAEPAPSVWPAPPSSVTDALARLGSLTPAMPAHSPSRSASPNDAPARKPAVADGTQILMPPTPASAPVPQVDEGSPAVPSLPREAAPLPPSESDAPPPAAKPNFDADDDDSGATLIGPARRY